MARKKKRNGPGKVDRKLLLSREAEDELVALEAIFSTPDEDIDGGNFRKHEDHLGFDLVVVPHPGDAEANFVWADIKIRLVGGYPEEPCTVKVQDTMGLSTPEKHALSKALHHEATVHAKQGEVCAFNLVDTCQEELRKHNEPKRAATSADTPPASLWHAMQERQRPSSSSSDGAEPGTPVADSAWQDRGTGDLFDSAAAPGTAATTWPLIQPTAAAPSSHAPMKEQRGQAAALGQQVSKGAATVESIAAGGLEADAAASRSRRGPGLAPEGSETSNSVMGNLMNTMRSGITALGRAVAFLPPVLRRTLRDDAGDGSMSESANSTDGEASREDLKKDLLLAHILSLLTKEGGSVPQHALPALVSHLTEKGLMPQWVQVILTQQPALFDRAVKKLFSEEIAEAEQSAARRALADKQEPAAWVLQHFWDRHSALEPSHALRPAVKSGVTQGLSRYETDFQELRTLGKGGYGLVVAAVNRLDGRQYAVKKIRMPSAAPVAYSRLMREVSTLARLQHPHVVRYFQAGSKEEGTDSTVPGVGFWQRHAGQSSTASADGTSTAPEDGRHSRRPEAEPPPQAQMLYIQMEFCPRTLREVLDRGPLNPEDSWQVMRQLLAGLAHIHAQGIIHRDLKPANIFYDARSDIKLGDFGLAKFASAAEAEAHDTLSTHSPSKELDMAERTGKVGTSFYISPEVAQGWASYNDRVDIFSLGIVAFELWHPFSTGMERVAALKDLQEQGALPAAWAAAHPKVAELIRWLTAANPAERPSAREVLRSELLPPTVGDEQLTDLLRSLPDNAEAFDRVVDSIFNMPVDNLHPEDVPGTPTAFQVSARQGVVEILESVFARHGAVPMDSNTLGFCPVDAPADTAELLSATGARLAMRYELRAPFAAWLARQAAGSPHNPAILESTRRYEVGWVRRKGVGRALPQAHLQADLDIATLPGSSPSETLLADAEVIRAVAEVMDALPDWVGDLEVRLGHRALLEAALVNARVPKELRGNALRLLATGLAASPRVSGARSEHWPSIKVALEGLGLPADAVSACKTWLLQVPGDAEAALHRLQTKLLDVPAGAKRASREVQGAVESLKLVTGHLAAWSLPKYVHVTVEPYLRPHAEYFSGVAFQVHVVQPMTGASSLVAVGGRYDGLIKAFWPLSQGPPMGAVGATLNVDRLIALANPHSHLRSSTLKASQAEVLVCARGGGGLLKERKALAALLWEAGIKAELVHAAAPSQTFQYEWAAARSIHWLVTINAVTFSTTDTVQVKNLERRTEEDVAYTAVVKYLVSVLPRFQQMLRREHVSLSQDEPDEELPEETRQERRSRYSRRNSERR